MDFDLNPLDEERPLSTRSNTNSQEAISKQVASIEARAFRQRPYFTLLTQFQELFHEIPDLTAKQADERVQAMYATLMEVCESVGISRISIPQLKECCGKKRIWKDEPKGLRLGDKLAWFFDKLGIKKCEACRKRQESLNKIRLPGS